MVIPLGTKGQADFAQPIELMMDCHRRIEHFLGVLQKCAQRYADQPLDDEGREALETALNYFHSAAPRHTADEEQSLFPRMREVNDPRVKQTMAAIDRLEADHRKVEAAHARLDALGRQWLNEDALGDHAFADFRDLLDDVATAYGEHIPIEDENVFVLAKQLLDDAQLRTVGEEMKQRRIDDPGRIGSRCAERRQQRLHTQEHHHA
jgi:hemerythrin-like domain-containing protein